jgi:tetratricopeptide (TPR) repeat protein
VFVSFPRLAALSLIPLALSCASTPAAKEQPPKQDEPPARPPRRPGEGGGSGKRELEDAKKLANGGDLDGAIKKSKEAIAKSPNMEEAYLLLGSACAMKEDEACEKDAYDRGTAALPQSASLMNESGLLRLRTGDAKGGVEQLERAHELSGRKDAKMMADLAYAYIFVNRLDDGAELAKKARITDPKSIEAAMAHGEVLLRKRDGAGAAEAFSVAIALTNDAEVKTNLTRQLAISYAMAGEHEKALEQYRSMLSGEGANDPVLRAQIAASLMNLDRAKDAVTEMQQAVKLAPDDTRFLGLLMKAQEKAGDKKGAAETKKRLAALGVKQ